MRKILQELGLNTGNSVVIGSGILQTLEIRKSNDIDIVTTQEIYNSLKKSNKFRIVKDRGREILKNDLFEIGKDWFVSGKSYRFGDFCNDSVVITGVRYIALDFLYKVKRAWVDEGIARQKDIKDVKLIEKYKQSGKLNLQEVRNYFTAKGYQPIKIEQTWRHVTGVLRKGNKNYFLKLATTFDIAKKTKNEFAWNNLINLMPDYQKLPFFVPPTHNSGQFKNLFWFLTDYVGDKILARAVDEKEATDLEKALPIIAQTAKKIINIKASLTLLLDEEITKEERKEKLTKQIDGWRKEIPQDTADLMKFIKERLNYLQTAPSHGDFVPWHFIQNDKTKLYLVDGESAHTLGLKFYDVAYFYHRVFTKLKRPDIADKFLKEFVNLYKFSKDEQGLFELVLAQRLIGGYFDARKDGITSISLQDQLKTRLLQKKLFLSRQ